jgi:hypothetical protein
MTRISISPNLVIRVPQVSFLRHGKPPSSTLPRLESERFRELMTALGGGPL